MESSLKSKQHRVQVANEETNLTNLIDCIKPRLDEDLSIDIVHASGLSRQKKRMLMKLLETNMREQYEESPSGWNEADKYAEMFGPSARHLVLSSGKLGDLVAFCHFRFDMDYGEDVLYCYEIQIHKNWRRKGLGRYIVTVLEKLMHIFSLSKVHTLVQRYEMFVFLI